MYKIEMHPTFCRVIAIFHAFGFWENGNQLTVYKVARKFLYLLNMILFQILIIASASITGDKSESLFLAQVEIIAIVMTVKLVYLLRNKNTILRFLSDSIVTHSVSDYGVKVKVEQKIKKFTKFVHVYLTVVGFVVFVLIISPLFTSNKMLPMFIIYSFEWKYSEFIYWLMYSPLAFQIFLIFVINLLTVVIWYVMLNCSIKYEILGNQFINLGVPMETINKTETISTVSLPECDSFNQELIGLVEVHQKIFEIIEQFRSSFSSIFIAQIVTSCISISSSNYVLTYSYKNDLLQLTALIFTFCYGIINIFVVMYLANSIKLESNKLSYCLFQSNWIEQSKSARKSVVIVGEVLKKPHELVIFKVFPMNLLTFATVANFAMALFNVWKKN